MTCGHAHPPHHTNRGGNGALELFERLRCQRARPGRETLELSRPGVDGAGNLRECHQQLVGPSRGCPGVLNQRGELSERLIRVFDQCLGPQHQPEGDHGHPDHGSCYNEHADLCDERHPGCPFPSDIPRNGPKSTVVSGSAPSEMSNKQAEVAERFEVAWVPDEDVGGPPCGLKIPPRLKFLPPQFGSARPGRDPATTLPARGVAWN